MLDRCTHGAAVREGAQGPEGLGQGSQGLKRERHAHPLDHSGRDGGVYEHRGIGRRGGFPALRRALFLCPTLERGQIVVMDNLQVHKMRKVREPIEGRGCSLVFLPSYSPGFSPTEEAFSKITRDLEESHGEDLRSVGGTEWDGAVGGDGRGRPRLL